MTTEVQFKYQILAAALKTVSKFTFKKYYYSLN